MNCSIAVGELCHLWQHRATGTAVCKRFPGRCRQASWPLPLYLTDSNKLLIGRRPPCPRNLHKTNTRLPAACRAMSWGQAGEASTCASSRVIAVSCQQERVRGGGKEIPRLVTEAANGTGGDSGSGGNKRKWLSRPFVGDWPSLAEDHSYHSAQKLSTRR